MAPETDYRARMRKLGRQTADATKQAATAEGMAQAAAKVAEATRVDLGEVDIVVKATLALAATVLPFSVALAGVRAGDALTVRPTAAWPAGFAPTGYALVTEPGKFEVRLNVPIITAALVGTITLKARVFALRTAVAA